MATNQDELIAWLKRGLEEGRLKLLPIEDEQGRILSVSIVLDAGGTFTEPDPRRVRPAGSLKTRPL